MSTFLATAAMTLFIPLASVHHVDPPTIDDVPQPWNEFNPGLGVEIPVFGNHALSVGAYRNSYRRVSVYAGLTYEKQLYRNLTYGLTYGLITGYEDDELLGRFGSVAPHAMPFLGFRVQRAGVRVYSIPFIVTGVGLTYDF